jgi:hypothetical protein
MVCFCFRVTRNDPDADQVDSHVLCGLVGCFERLREGRSTLHIEGRASAPTHRGTHNKKVSDASRRRRDLGNMEGPNAAYYRGCGFRGRWRGADVFLSVRDNPRVCVRAANDELIG